MTAGNLTQACLMEDKPKRRKPRKQTVYVLTGSYEYENTHVLGIYTSSKRAEKAREAGQVRDESKPYPHAWQYDFYSIDGIVVNA